MANDKIPVIEIFGPTIQGEGSMIGRKTMFIRTAGCDYRCAWCDSAFTWDGSAKDQIKMMTPHQIYQHLLDISTLNMRSGVYGHDRNFDHVTISGGNPALISQPMQELIWVLHKNGIRVGVETQGSKWQDWFRTVDDLTISPKPPSSGMTTDWKVLDDIIDQLTMPRTKTCTAVLKVVVFMNREDDWEYAKKVRKRYPHVNMFVSVGNTEIGKIDPEHHREILLDSLEWLFDKIIGDPEMNNVRPLPQLHTLVWGNKRGV